MHATIKQGEKEFLIDLSKPIDISISLKSGASNLTAWYSGPPVITPVEGDGFIGDVKQGGSVNFRDIYFNPHAHGTHTECVGHISELEETISDTLKNFFFFAQLVTITPQRLANGDDIITLDQFQELAIFPEADAIIVRTLPNDESKKSRQYSETNPPFVEHTVMTFLIELGICHFLIDLPSVDREKDEGALRAHKAFWEYPQQKNNGRTITEFVYIPDKVADDVYFMNLQVANFQNDAGPSRPVIYPIIR